MYQLLLTKSKGLIKIDGDQWPWPTNCVCTTVVHCVRQMYFPIYVQLHVIVSGRCHKYWSSWWKLYFLHNLEKQAGFINFGGSRHLPYVNRDDTLLSITHSCYTLPYYTAILLYCYTIPLCHTAILYYPSLTVWVSHQLYYYATTLLYHTTMPYYALFFTIFQPPFPYPDHLSSRKIIQPGLNLSLQIFEFYINFELYVQVRNKIIFVTKFQQKKLLNLPPAYHCTKEKLEKNKILFPNEFS